MSEAVELVDNDDEGAGKSSAKYRAKKYLPTDPQKEISKQNNLNFFSRWIDDSRFFGGAFQGQVSYEALQNTENATENAYHAQVGTVVQGGSGFIMGILFHFIFKRFYKNQPSLNPVYRTFKTLASVGVPIGLMLGYLLPLPSSARAFFAAVFTDIACLVIGLFALPYWLIRQYILKTPQNLRHKFTKTGSEGWSKYAKTALVLGTFVGQVLSSCYAFITQNLNFKMVLAIGTSIGGIVFFAASLILVPLINKFFSKKLMTTNYDIYIFDKETISKTIFPKNRKALILTRVAEKCEAYFIENGKLNTKPVSLELSPRLLAKIKVDWHKDAENKVENVGDNDPSIDEICTQACLKTGKLPPREKFRNNYVRTGVSFGLAVGSIIGFILGTFIFPGIGSLIGMAIVGGVGALIGGTVFGAQSHKISLYFQKKFNATKIFENAWDYATRNTAGACAMLGAAIGFFVPVPGGALVGAAIGSACGSLFGWFAGLTIFQKARKLTPDEKNSDTLPWTQRMGTGTTIGCVLGGAIGLCIGLLGGPIGAIAGATLGIAIGGFVGSLGGAVADKKARGLIKQAIFSKPEVSATAVVDAPLPVPQLTETLSVPCTVSQINAICLNQKMPTTISIDEDLVESSFAKPKRNSLVDNRYHSFNRKVPTAKDIFYQNDFDEMEVSVRQRA